MARHKLTPEKHVAGEDLTGTPAHWVATLEAWPCCVWISAMHLRWHDRLKRSGQIRPHVLAGCHTTNDNAAWNLPWSIAVQSKVARTWPDSADPGCHCFGFHCPGCHAGLRPGIHVSWIKSASSPYMQRAESYYKNSFSICNLHLRRR